MKSHEVVTLIDQLEDYVKAVIRNQASDSEVEALVLSNMRESLKEYICLLVGIKPVPQDEDYKCPECNGAMAERFNRQNGNKFYGCKRYPNCKGTRDENGLSRQDREEAQHKKDMIAQQSGFSFNKKPGRLSESGPIPND